MFGKRQAGTETAQVAFICKPSRQHNTNTSSSKDASFSPYFSHHGGLIMYVAYHPNLPSLHIALHFQHLTKKISLSRKAMLPTALVKFFPHDARNMLIMARICICMFRSSNINRVPNVNQDISLCNQPLASHPACISRYHTYYSCKSCYPFQHTINSNIYNPPWYCDPVGFGLAVSDLPPSKV